MSIPRGTRVFLTTENGGAADYLLHATFSPTYSATVLACYLPAGVPFVIDGLRITSVTAIVGSPA